MRAGVKSSSWIKHGFLNTLEHALTRGSDAATSLLLLWALSPESFSKIAIAQAWVAPLLFFFIAPESVLYRDFARWKTAGPEVLRARLHAFRVFAWGKGLFALVASAALATVYGGSSPWSVRLFALLWAFGVVLAPQVSGPDREFLRLDLRLKELNLVSLLQKTTLLAGVMASALFFKDRLDVLALTAVLSLSATAWVSRRFVEQGFGGVECDRSVAIVGVLRESVHSFSLWSHLIGVILGWVQTMDLFFLSVFRFPARELGLYAAILKIANFSMALPTALGSLFSVWLGRRSADAGAEELKIETQRLRKGALTLFGALILQGGVILLFAPWAFRILSHGRWSSDERHQMMFWLGWVLLGCVIQAALYLHYCWLLFRRPAKALLFGVYLPWGILSVATYASAIAWGGAEHGVNYAAYANVVVALVYAILISINWSLGRGLHR